MSEIFLGRIVKAFGIRGELKFHPSDDFWPDVLMSRRLHMQSDGKAPQLMKIDRLRPHGNSYVVKLDGVNDRNAAELMVGKEVVIDEDTLDVELPEHLLPYQVVGLNVFGEDGVKLGVVSQVIYSAAHDVYEIKSADGTFMVPAVPEFIVEVDLDERRLVVRPQPGLIGE